MEDNKIKQKVKNASGTVIAHSGYLWPPVGLWVETGEMYSLVTVLTDDQILTLPNTINLSPQN
jgi:hypothetical protein